MPSTSIAKSPAMPFNYASAVFGRQHNVVKASSYTIPQYTIITLERSPHAVSLHPTIHSLYMFGLEPQVIIAS